MANNLQYIIENIWNKKEEWYILERKYISQCKYWSEFRDRWFIWYNEIIPFEDDKIIFNFEENQNFEWIIKNICWKSQNELYEHLTQMKESNQNFDTIEKHFITDELINKNWHLLLEENITFIHNSEALFKEIKKNTKYEKLCDEKDLKIALSSIKNNRNN